MRQNIAGKPLWAITIELSATADDGAAQVSLDRWRKVFDKDKANQAVEELAVDVKALNLIRDTEAKSGGIEQVRRTGNGPALTEAFAKVSSVLARVERFSKFNQDKWGKEIKPLELKHDVREKFRNITRLLDNSIIELGKFFNLTEAQLELPVKPRPQFRDKKAQNTPEELPFVVPIDADELAKLATDISAVAPAALIVNDAQAQSTINACAQSVNTIIDTPAACRELVNQHIVVPAFERVDSALAQIKQDAANKVSLSPAIDELVDSVKNLAFVHHIRKSSEINLPPRMETTAEKRSASPSRGVAGPSKRAREASVAKALNFGRWGGMSERRANIYGLL